MLTQLLFNMLNKSNRIYSPVYPDGWLPQFLFFYMPVGVIFTLNIALFVLTGMKIHQIHLDAERMSSQEDCANLKKVLKKKRDK